MFIIDIRKTFHFIFQVILLFLDITYYPSFLQVAFRVVLQAFFSEIHLSTVILQWRIQIPVRHLRWNILRK